MKQECYLWPVRYWFQGGFVAVLWLTLGSSLVAMAAPLQVFAAASLTDCLKEIGTGYEKATGDRVQFNFAASSLLARQIEMGAPADVFFSADEAKMDQLQQKDLILNETRRTPLSNELVVVVAAEDARPLRSGADLASDRVKRVALADPKTVPAGIYAKGYLERAGLWPTVAPKVIPTDNVRAALSAVALGNVDAGIVYRTDAAISQKVKVAYAIPASEAPPISYSLAVLKNSSEAATARHFVEYLCTTPATTVFRKHGFIVRQ